MEPVKAKVTGKPWTEEEDKTLISGWQFGHSPRTIANLLGRTRNSIIGRHDRLIHPRKVEPSQQPEQDPIHDHPHRKPGRLEFLRTRG